MSRVCSRGLLRSIARRQVVGQCRVLSSVQSNPVWRRYTNPGDVRNSQSLQCRRWISSFPSRLPEVQLPEMTFFDYVSQDFHLHAGDPAIIFPARNVVYKFEELKPLIHKLGSGLARRGLCKHKVCLLFMKNNAEYLPMVYAITNIGGVVSTSNPAYTAEELAHQIQDCGSTYIITTPDLLDTVQQAVDASRMHIQEIFIVGEKDGYTTYADLASDDGTAFPNVKIDYKNDTAFLPYSSGTTGLPKGVMLTHYNLAANVAQARPLLGYEPRSHHLVFLPLFHMFGLVPATAYALLCGACVVIMDKFDGKEFLENIQEYNVTNIPVVPPVMTFLAKADLVSQYDVSSVVDMICGAAPLSADLQAEVKRKLGLRCRQGYGMTEVSPVLTLDDPHADPVPGSAGLIIPNTEIKIVDIETGESLGVHKEGEIVARGPQIMKGYLNNEQATKQTVRDGWIYTGDVGYVDETNHLFVVDRVKELIKYKAFQVAPAELEGVLNTHPEVADSGVVGVPDYECGELPKAFIVLKPGSKLTEADLHDYVAGRVAKYKHLKGGIEFVKEIPRSPSGKILRRILRTA